MDYYYSNSAERETGFVVEIDNQSTTTAIKNFLIGKVEGKDGRPIGIVQFINKIDESEKMVDIDEHDIEQFMLMKGLLGMCIDNTMSISAQMNMSISINDSVN